MILIEKYKGTKYNLPISSLSGCNVPRGFSTIQKLCPGTVTLCPVGRYWDSERLEFIFGTFEAFRLLLSHFPSLSGTSDMSSRKSSALYSQFFGLHCSLTLWLVHKSNKTLYNQVHIHLLPHFCILGLISLFKNYIVSLANLTWIWYKNTTMMRQCYCCK